MKFIKLTLASTKKPVWINVNHIVEVYQYHMRDTAVVTYDSKDEDGFAEVLESVDEVMEKINEALND